MPSEGAAAPVADASGGRVRRPVVVETDRLVLSPPVESERAHWVALHRDPRTYAHAPHAMAPSDEAASAAYDGYLAHWREYGFGFWTARERATGEIVGVCGLREVHGDAHFLNLYYRLAHDALGRGLGKEMARACVVHAQEWLPGLPVWALVKEHNDASVATALACGMERTGARVLKDDLPDEPPSTIFVAPSVTGVDALDDELREKILDLWCAVNDAGGAVGFLPGASRSAVAQALAGHESTMAAGRCQAVLLRSAAGRLAGLAFLERPANPLLGHGRWLYRVMTDPGARGRGLGSQLMAGVHRLARADDVEIVSLGVRGGPGTDRFYARCGYAEVGRIRGAIRVAPGDDRDDITMSRRLDGG
jgi:RimJ/RimL family protein N-acetyltransferase